MSDSAAVEPDTTVADDEAVEADVDAEAAADEVDDETVVATADPDDEASTESEGGEAADRDLGEMGDGSPISVLSVIEAILFASDCPLPAAKIARVVAAGKAREIKKHIETLNERYETVGAAYRIEEGAGGYQMLTLPDFHPWLSKLRQTRAMNRLTKPALETLAIVAYRQPALRADVEVVRGVASGEVLNRLREMGLVAIVGRAEEIGRPMLYGTTRRFLEVFGLQRLEDLPAIEELKPPS